MAEIPEDVYEPQTQSRVAGENGYNVLIVTGDKVEDLEFFYPYYRFIEAGCKVDVATLKGGDFKGKHDIGLTQSLKIEDVSADNYQLLYLPGGKAPAKLKDEKTVVELVRDFVASGKPIAAICHGPQILAAANVISGYEIAGWPEIEDEIKNAGAIYANAETVVDGQFITARWPADLPMHLKRTLEILESTKQLSSLSQLGIAS